MTSEKLLAQWNATASEERTVDEYQVSLPLTSAARIHALAELYPGRSEEELIADLLALALSDLEAAFPYVPGDEIIALDEFDNPVYEDVGITPRFNALTREYLRRLESRQMELSSYAGHML